MSRQITGTIFNIQKFAVHDGPGIRTTVFMKGCPLRCLWCSNAESMNPEPELGIIRSRCNACGRCLDICPVNALSFDEHNVLQVERKTCTACGQCVAVCVPEALAVYGRKVTVNEVFDEVIKDKAFYRDSGGGVTASGGEPLRQADFVAALFEMCHENGIHTCLDTSGCAPAAELEKVLPFVDYVLFDIKLIDAEKHREFTGVSNDLILNNAKIVASSGAEMLCRIPLINGVNDSPENITATAKFVRSLGDDIGIEMLPYHRLGIGKYATLDRDYPGKELMTPSEAEIETLKKLIEQNGVTVAAG